MAGRRRAPQQTANQRRDDSRQRLIEAALDVFGLYGFEGASTRLLAERANVNLAAIPYYFGSKEGLYRAVAEHVAKQISASQASVVGKAKAALESPDLSTEAALAQLEDVLDSFAAMVIGSEGADHWARFIMREQMDPTPAFDILYQTVMNRVHGVCTALVARILGQAEDDPDALIRTTTIIGQILVFRAARAAVLRRLGWEAFTDDRIETIQRAVREQTRAILLQARAQRR